jgi:polynucleotide 5'-kinase involved in rRNA processing
MHCRLLRAPGRAVLLRGLPGLRGPRGLRQSGARLSSSPSLSSSFFPASRQQLLESEQRALSRLADILRTLGDPDPAQLRLIQETRAKLDDIFMLVVIGEFNSGKSTFINALLGRKVLKEGNVCNILKLYGNRIHI